MPGGSGLELLRAISGQDVKSRIILLTAVVDDDQLLEAIRLGAQGVVLKDMAPQLLVDAVREVHGGGQWLEQGLGGRALRRLLMREKRSSEGARRLLHLSFPPRTAPPSVHKPIHDLTTTPLSDSQTCHEVGACPERNRSQRKCEASLNASVQARPPSS